MGDQGRVPRTITLSVKSLFVVLLIAAAAVGAYFVTDLAAEQEDLESEVEALAEIVQVQQREIDSALEELETKGSTALIPLRRRVTTIAACLPEIQAQLNTLEVDFGFAFPSDSPSQRCRAVLYGDPIEGGE